MCSSDLTSESLLCEQDRDADCDLDRKRYTVRDRGGDGGGEIGRASCRERV